MKQNIIAVDNIDTYNKWYSQETLHPLVTVVDQSQTPEWFNGTTLRYGLYGIFLKQGDGCVARYGREKYDYQAGTIVTYSPGQMLSVEWDSNNPMPPSKALLFHPDIICGTPLGKKINDYSFFSYDQREALHVSDRERQIIENIIDQIESELEHPVDTHSQTLITDSIALLLDYFSRYYERQFITRHKVCSEVFATFERQLKDYFVNGNPETNGIPTVAFFAEKACLSTGYFGDLIKSETGTTAQQHIQNAIIQLAKQLLLEGDLPISQIAYQLGFQYSQHFTRLFKNKTGMSPLEFRRKAG